MTRAAAIDIGTNSTRLLVADVAGGRVNVVKTGLLTTRLGQGINCGCLLPGAMARTADAVAGFFEEAFRMGVSRVAAAATSAVRDASNRDEFLALLKNRAGLEAKVLSGEEEARLSYRGALSGLGVDPLITAVADVGGGSTELVWREGGHLRFRSVNAGAVRMTASAAGEMEIAAVLSLVLEEARRGGIQNLAGVGGTATTCAAIDLGLHRYDSALTHGYILTLQRLTEILSLLSSLSLTERKKVPGLQPERADIIVAGVTILTQIVAGLGLDRLLVSEADILFGLVLEQVENL